ncbi:hypothetical protein VNO77_08348 [Canavalia gladiata]|uniref:Uncharacterized protein n=1 Tax=Canavalia gladiata TaxID=3824 RepID=A0AAN9MDW3_CANGL
MQLHGVGSCKNTLGLLKEPPGMSSPGSVSPSLYVKSRRMGLLSILAFPSLTSFGVAVRASARCSYLGNLRPVGRSPSDCFINIIQSLRVIEWNVQWLCHASHGHVRSSISLDISRKVGGLSVIGAYRSSESLLIEKTLNSYSCL